MTRSIKAKRLACLSISLLLLVVSPAAYGQAPPTASAEQIQALQKKLDPCGVRCLKCRASYNGCQVAAVRRPER